MFMCSGAGQQSSTALVPPHMQWKESPVVQFVAKSVVIALWESYGTEVGQGQELE